jgi:Uma2 family endonuclease
MNSAFPIKKLLRDADAIGVRLEIIDGLPVWEASPVYFHQAKMDRIRSTIKPLEGGQCEHVLNVYFRFEDGSVKRPDIALLPRKPLESEMDSALEIVPEAVIEIISEGYEDKDLRLAPGFYLTQGVKDVLIFDPRAKLIWHHRADGVGRFNSPQAFKLECGCECVV